MSECSCSYPNPKWGDTNPSCEVHGACFESARTELAEYALEIDRLRSTVRALTSIAASLEKIANPPIRVGESRAKMPDSKDIEAIHIVLDKLVAQENRPVEFASDFFQRHHLSLSPLTSEEVVAAREALANLKAAKKPGFERLALSTNFRLREWGRVEFDATITVTSESLKNWHRLITAIQDVNGVVSVQIADLPPGLVHQQLEAMKRIEDA